MKRMVSKLLLAGWCGWSVLALPALAETAAPLAAAVPAPALVPTPTIGQIIERNVAARGGLEAWRKIQSMAWTGQIESGPNAITKTPFLMIFKRPNATRFEVITQQQRSVRVFDGSKGWKLRPTLQGLPELKDYSPEELSYARDGAWLDGPLLDYQAKGVKVALLGSDLVEGHPAFHLKLTLVSGQLHDYWIDAQSYLELRHDRPNRNMAGVPGVVSEYFRDYHTVSGLTLPFLVETGVGAAKYPDRMVIEKIALNPELEARQFEKPFVPHKGHNGVIVNTQAPDAPH
jgi:hypothetical protein